MGNFQQLSTKQNLISFSSASAFRRSWVSSRNSRRELHPGDAEQDLMFVQPNVETSVELLQSLMLFDSRRMWRVNDLSPDSPDLNLHLDDCCVLASVH